jgi:hypothetical protein
LQPHTAKDFTVRGLADRIRDLEQLHFVYTQDERIVDKEEMFSRYYSKSPNPPSQPNDGYVKAEIQVKFSSSYAPTIFFSRLQFPTSQEFLSDHQFTKAVLHHLARHQVATEIISL